MNVTLERVRSETRPAAGHEIVALELGDGTYCMAMHGGWVPLLHPDPLVAANPDARAKKPKVQWQLVAKLMAAIFPSDDVVLKKKYLTGDSDFVVRIGDQSAKIWVGFSGGGDDPDVNRLRFMIEQAIGATAFNQRIQD